MQLPTVRVRTLIAQADSEDKKRRYIVFVGNLSYGVTREDLEAHFKPAGLIPNSLTPISRPIQGTMP